MFDWDDLKVFLSAYREGSIGRAAESLGMSGSTVSRRLTGLEEALGEPLFVRSPDGLIPTETAGRILRSAEDTERSAARIQTLLSSGNTPRGNVRVSASNELLHTVIVPSWPQFVRQWPEITVDFVEGTALADLQRWEADIAIRTSRPLSGDSLVVTKIRDTGFGLFASRRLLEHHGLQPDDAHGLREAATTRWSELPWVDWTADRTNLPIARLRQQLYPRARVVFRGSNMETLRSAAGAGVGLVLLPSFFGRVTPGLVSLPAPELPAAQPLFLLGHSATRHTACVDAVWTHLYGLLYGEDDRDLDRARDAISRAYGVRYDD